MNFQLLLMTTCEDDGTAVFPDKLEKLDNTRVLLTGFMTPYDDPKDMGKLLLTKNSSSCYFCNPPEANGVIFVRLSPDAARPTVETATVTLEGTLHLVRHDCQDAEAKQFCFTLDDTKITNFKPTPESTR